MGNFLQRLVKHDSGKANTGEANCGDANVADAQIDEGPTLRARRYLAALLCGLVVALTIFALLPDRLWAAIELAYYRAASTNNAVFLEWATVREVNTNGFEILCKRVIDPDTAFHPIGSRIALGSPTSGATYNFDVTSGLVPGERYCFRLREITNDDTPGEAFDLCGYGLGLSPPPTSVSVVVSIPITLTPTIVSVTPVPGLSPAPTLAPTIDPFATATPTLDPFATATPTLDPFATATPTLDPFATATWTPDPFATATATIDPLSVPTATQPQSVLALPTTGLETPAITSEEMTVAAAQIPPLETLTETLTTTPSVTPTETATWTPTTPVTVTETPTATATLTTTIPLTLTPSAAAIDPNALPVIPESAAPLTLVDATPTPLYVVVTATPTPLAAVAVAPTFTPWPTAVPTQAFAMTNLLVPSTQNLMVGLLCLIFLSASGLGALGLVTSVLYMRSQSRRDQLPGPSYDRRRY